MTRFAVAGKGGSFGAMGFVAKLGVVSAFTACPNTLAMLRAANPTPIRDSASRRVRNISSILSVCFDIRSSHDRLIVVYSIVRPMLL